MWRNVSQDGGPIPRRKRRLTRSMICSGIWATCFNQNTISSTLGSASIGRGRFVSSLLGKCAQSSVVLIALSTSCSIAVKCAIAKSTGIPPTPGLVKLGVVRPGGFHIMFTSTSTVRNQLGVGLSHRHNVAVRSLGRYRVPLFPPRSANCARINQRRFSIPTIGLL